MLDLLYTLAAKYKIVTESDLSVHTQWLLALFLKTLSYLFWEHHKLRLVIGVALKKDNYTIQMKDRIKVVARAMYLQIT